MSAEPFTPSADAPESVRIFGVILRALVQTVARLFHRRPDRVVLVLPMAVWFGRAVKRLERAMARPIVEPSGMVPPVADPRERAAQKKRARFPGQRMWLVRELGWEVAAYAGQLQHLLSQPEMQTALATRPAVGRILRPICRMLGIDVPGMAKAVPPKPAKPRQPREPRAKRERPWEPGRNASLSPSGPGLGGLARNRGSR